MFTPAVQLLILCNVAVYVAQNLLGLRLIGMLALWPLGPHFHLWQLVTYAFVHGGLAHIAFNMLGLAVFGTDLERVWGSARLISCYLLSVLAAAATQLLLAAATGSTAPTIGASGDVRLAPGICHAVSTATDRAAIPANPHAGMGICPGICSPGTRAGRHRNGSGGRPLCASRRHAWRLSLHCSIEATMALAGTATSGSLPSYG